MTYSKKVGGLRYDGGIIGKFLFRVRESHIRDHIAPLLSKNAVGAAKLDLALRGIALDPRHQGNRPEPGIVIPRHSYSALHDLVRDGSRYGDPEDSSTVRLKRKWMGEQLQRLENLNLLKRVD